MNFHIYYAKNIKLCVFAAILLNLLNYEDFIDYHYDSWVSSGNDENLKKKNEFR